MAKTKINIA